ncbi:MAG: DNA polymerase III subunit alpha [Gammaproteobacteria bacterium]|nr:DNA polymerase III subunit alpha [Gammaproteobacteria bacterium]MYE52465.1 DNA polymerase III subunit alpha [Gammaproteobacteria bacterium]
MSAVEFVHLRTHSEYSIVDGLAGVDDLARRAAELGMGAIGLTDHGNLFGLIKFYRACLKAGIKPIVGVDLPHQAADAGEPLRLTVIACGLAGYRNLIQLASLAYVGGEHHGAVTTAEVLDRSDGLIALSGARDTEVGRALLRDDDKGALQAAGILAERFGDRFYLEAQRTGREDEETCLRGAVALAERLELPMVATNEACFLAPEDFEAHETRVCIHEGKVVNDPRRPRRYSAEQHLKGPEDMAQLFADLPEALANSVEIAKRCTLELELDKPQLPDYPVPKGESLESFLAKAAEKGLAERLEELRALNAYALDESAYRDRLADELRIINETGFPGYFLVVMEFIAWAKEQGIPVGPGRGSGAGSLVAYALRITDLDPVHYDLLFERFLNPERVSMPDFDVDFCVEGRDRVIHHVSELYGNDAVSQIATFGTMAAKAVVRDVARAQGKPYALGDKLSKLIPNELNIKLRDAVAKSPELRDFISGDEEAAEIMDMGYKLEGIVRNVGRHAGGVVIAPSRLTDFVPLYVDERSDSLISQYDKDDVEKAGLVKFDFLGLTTLTIIDWAVQTINRAIEARGGGTLVDINRVPLDDAATFDLLKRAETTAVFQLESRGMKDLVRRLLPDRFDDILALVALFRPGPLDNGTHDDYINRKHGKEGVSYPHDDLEPVLSSTFGTIIYQEQVMQIARLLAGFSLGQADILRKAMGKKDPQEMAKVRSDFLAGADANGVSDKLAQGLFKEMETFAGYAFNKSHSATYGLIAYQTAWLKAHHPAEFMAANLSAAMDHTDKVVTLINEVRRMGLKLRPPSVNLSEFRFSVIDGDIIYGLGAVRGVGWMPVESIVNARKAGVQARKAGVEGRQDGRFESLAAFCLRVDVKRANKRVIEALIHAGAMDELGAAGEDLGLVRAKLLGELDQALQAADQQSRDAALGIGDLFGGVGEDRQPALRAAIKPQPFQERIELERGALGLYLTGHPVEPLFAEFSARCQRLDELRPKEAERVFGLLIDLRRMRGRKGRNAGQEWAVAVIDDSTARVEAMVYAKTYERIGHKLEQGQVLVLEGEVQPDEYNGAHKIIVETAFTIDEWREENRPILRIDMSHKDAPADFSSRLAASLQPYRVAEGGSPVFIDYQAPKTAGSIRLGWRVKASEALVTHLKTEYGDDRVRVRMDGR